MKKGITILERKSARGLVTAVGLLAICVMVTTAAASPQERAADTPLQRAATAVRQAQAPVKWVAPGPAFSAKAARGKTVAWIAVNMSIPFVQKATAGFKAAATVAGLKVIYFDSQSQPSKMSSAIERAVAQKVDLIVLYAIPVRLVSASIQDAFAARIPVIESFNHDSGKRPTPRVTAEVSYCYSCIGRLMADFAAVQSGGKVNAVVFTSSDIDVSRLEVGGITSELRRVCPKTCKVKVVDVPLADWQTKLASLTESLVSDPSINYIFPLYDGEVPFIVPAVHARGAQDRVKVVSSNASVGVMDFLAKRDVLVADVGQPNTWSGWAFADQVLRILSGKAPVRDEKIPMRLFTAKNFGAKTLRSREDAWYGRSNFKNSYLRLWKLRQ